MPNPYSTDEWRKFRAEVIELDGQKCRRCNRSAAQDVVLQVHHLKYEKGKRPWEYPYSLCETICKGCHAKEHGIIRPIDGWECSGETDLGDLCGTCEYCGTAIRYEFHVQHPHWEPMDVGTICCDSLTGTTHASDHMETVRKHEGRLCRFLSSPRWTTENGKTSIRQKSLNVVICQTAAEFRIQMNGCQGRKTFPTIDAAKRFAFEVIDNGTAEEFLKRRK
jgi:hypothetical protein